MALADEILREQAVGQPAVDVSGLGGITPVVAGGGVQPVLAAPPPESTLAFDPLSLPQADIGPIHELQEDISLATSRKTAGEVEQEALNKKLLEQETAKGVVIGAGIRAGADIWENMANLKAEDVIFQQKLQRGFEDLEFNKSMIRNSRNIAVLNQSIQGIKDLRRQAGGALAGAQQQIFLNEPDTGRPV